MQREARHREVEWAIARVAGEQHGLVSRAQLAGLGVGPGAIAYRVRIGRLHPLHRGVYLVGHGTASRRALELGAVLALGAATVLSHRSAARFWALLPYPGRPEEVEVTVTARKPHSRPGIRVHRTETVPRSEWTIRDGIPVTQVPRTLLDLAAVAPRRDLEAAINEAQALRLAGRRQIEAIVERHRGRPGARLLGETSGVRVTRSPSERLLLELLDQAGIRPPETNVRLLGHEVDCLWRDERLIVETDGWAAHGSRSAFERDRRRDAQLVAAGFRVIRVTWAQLTRSPGAVVRTIKLALAQAGGGVGSSLLGSSSSSKSNGG